MKYFNRRLYLLDFVRNNRKIHYALRLNLLRIRQIDSAKNNRD